MHDNAPFSSTKNFKEVFGRVLHALTGRTDFPVLPAVRSCKEAISKEIARESPRMSPIPDCSLPTASNFDLLQAFDPLNRQHAR